jgi:hypothetical protein
MIFAKPPMVAIEWVAPGQKTVTTLSVGFLIETRDGNHTLAANLLLQDGVELPAGIVEIPARSVITVHRYGQLAFRGPVYSQQRPPADGKTAA